MTAIPLAENIALALACCICDDFILVGQLYHGDNGSPKSHIECWAIDKTKTPKASEAA